MYNLFLLPSQIYFVSVLVGLGLGRSRVLYSVQDLDSSLIQHTSRDMQKSLASSLNGPVEATSAEPSMSYLEASVTALREGLAATAKLLTPPIASPPVSEKC